VATCFEVCLCPWGERREGELDSPLFYVTIALDHVEDSCVTDIGQFTLRLLESSKKHEDDGMSRANPLRFHDSREKHPKEGESNDIAVLIRHKTHQK
jgi:hypothetical protein